MARKTKFETTLGDLIVALTEETGRHVRDERTTYEVVAYILDDLIDDSNRRLGLVASH
jgi:hypothetical protein